MSRLSPSRPRVRARAGLHAGSIVGAVTVAAVTAMVVPLTANAQSAAPGSLSGSLDAGSSGSAGSGSAGSGSAGSIGSVGSAGSAGSLGAPAARPEDRYPDEPLPAGPGVEVETLVGGLTIPWDVVRDPNGVVVTGERGTGRVVAIHPDGTTTDVAADFGDLFTGGESGLMGVALAPDFAQSREVYTCPVSYTHLTLPTIYSV